MKMGFILPGGSAPEQLEQALMAEAADWDGIFVWEAAYGVDAWALLAAIAVHTRRIRLGTLLTPLPPLPGTANRRPRPSVDLTGHDLWRSS
jgi:alkanesulfonate monooxygenase SsuD/methylene tetrahydromethanopterin reductase-like flavin-dependent oxidoreductase (luciferase family)